MKIAMCLLLSLLLTMSCALAEFDNAALERLENMFIYQEPGTFDTVVQPMNQPYMGQLDDGDLDVYIDYIRKPALGMTLLRLYVSVTIYDAFQADQMALTVGGKRYTFDVDSDQSEYDGIYMCDYVVCLTAESLPFLKAVAQQKKDDPIPVEFLYLGDVGMKGDVILPGDDAAMLYDRFIDFGGKNQDLKSLDAEWPCEIVKAE